VADDHQPFTDGARHYVGRTSLNITDGTMRRQDQEEDVVVGIHGFENLLQRGCDRLQISVVCRARHLTPEHALIAIKSERGGGDLRLELGAMRDWQVS
jgi:hypothetical protein